MGTNKIVTYEIFKYSDDDSKYFIGYLHDDDDDDDDVFRPLCIILPQMSRCIKHFDNGGKKYLF